MMAERCIYANDFLDLFYVASTGQDKMFVEVVEQVVEDTPTADVAEVVRCKDCKRCYEKRTKRNNQLMRFCMRMDGNEYQVNANDFCSYGTPKERGWEK